MAVKLGIMPKKTKSSKLENGRDAKGITGIIYKNAGKCKNDLGGKANIMT